MNLFGRTWFLLLTLLEFAILVVLGATNWAADYVPKDYQYSIQLIFTSPAAFLLLVFGVLTTTVFNYYYAEHLDTFLHPDKYEFASRVLKDLGPLKNVKEESVQLRGRDHQKRLEEDHSRLVHKLVTKKRKIDQIVRTCFLFSRNCDSIIENSSPNLFSPPSNISLCFVALGPGDTSTLRLGFLPPPIFKFINHALESAYQIFMTQNSIVPTRVILWVELLLYFFYMALYLNDQSTDQQRYLIIFDSILLGFVALLLAWSLSPLFSAAYRSTLYLVRSQHISAPWF